MPVERRDHTQDGKISAHDFEQFTNGSSRVGPGVIKVTFDPGLHAESARRHRCYPDLKSVPDGVQAEVIGTRPETTDWHRPSVDAPRPGPSSVLRRRPEPLLVLSSALTDDDEPATGASLIAAC
jgi:hypothetical protein